MLRLSLLALTLSTPCLAQEVSVGDVLPDLSALTTPSIAGFEYFGDGRPGLTLTMAPNDRYTLDITIEETGFLDDSVEGQRRSYEVTYTADGWEVLAADTLYRCYRGDNRDWQSALCP